VIFLSAWETTACCIVSKKIILHLLQLIASFYIPEGIIILLYCHYLRFMNLLVVLLLVLFFKASGHTAQDNKFKILQPEQNLSNGCVQAIYKDSDGYVWFGTLNELNRYDGVTSKLYLVHSPAKGRATFENEPLFCF
jgi:hypothetical protein